jgi:hypothetical protein
MEYILIVLCLFGSAFFSGTEIAYTSLSKLKIKKERENPKGIQRLVLFIYDHFDNALSTLLIGNNLVNIAATSIATVMAVKLADGLGGRIEDDTASTIVTVVMTVLILIFGEITPKMIARRCSETFAKIAAWPLLILMILFFPIVWLTTCIVNIFSLLWKKDGQEVTITDPDVTEPTVEEPIQSDDYNVTFTEEVRDDGTFQLSITSGLEIVSTVRFELYYLDESSGKYIRLGSDNNLYADWTAGVFTDNFWGKWLSIDGHYVEADIIGQGVDYSLYSIPVLLNDEEYNLWARYDYEKKRYVILGCFQGIDPDTGLSSRDVLELHRGDHIQFLFRTYDPATGAEGYATMGDISYTSRTKMEEMDLVDGRYLYRYVITDTFGNVYYSNPAQMRCDSGDIYVSEVQF